MVNIPHSKRLPDGTLVPCTLLEWAEWAEAPETDNVLLRTAVPFGPENTEAVLIVTKFTGYDLHVDWDMCPGAVPMMFETHARHRELSQPERRYQTEDEAREGHEDVVRRIRHLVRDRKGTDPIDQLLMPALVNRPKRLPPAPDCVECRGEGEVLNRFEMWVICECTIPRRKP